VAIASIQCACGQAPDHQYESSAISKGTGEQAVPDLQMYSTLEPEELSVPNGVDADLWEHLLQALSESRMRANADRYLSRAPQGQQNMIKDLSLETIDGSSATLNWSYRSVGDYDQNSEVNIADLTAIGINFGKSSASPDWNRARLADGDENGLITISDVTPIGNNYGNRTSGYSIRRSSQSNPDSYQEIAFVEFMNGSVSPELPWRTYSTELTGLIEGDSLLVVPLDSSDGTSGTASADVQFSSGIRPLNVQASQGSLAGAIDITWDSVPDASGYIVERRHLSQTIYEFLDETTEEITQFSDTDVAEGVHRFYRVAAMLGAGQSAWSDAAEGWSMSRPPTPVGLTASDGSVLDAVELSWDPVADADGYYLYRDQALDPLAEVIGTQYTDANVVDPSIHQYELSAYNAAGEGSRSSLEPGNAGIVPDAPQQFAASQEVHETHVNLSWQASQWASGYRIYREVDDNLLVEIGDVDTYEDFSVSDFSEHPYWISAITALGESSLSGPQNGSRKLTAPAAPTGLTASQGSLRDTIHVSWTASSGAEQYLVYRDGNATPIATLGNVVTFNDNVLPDLLEHAYQIRARNGAGDSALSTMATGYPDNRSEWWRFGRDNLHSSRSSAAGPALNTLAWSYPTGSWIRCNPVMAADGTVYFGNYAGKLTALNPDGSFKWEYSAGDDIYTAAAIAPDGTVYVGSHDFKLHAVNPDGSGKWTYTTGGIVRSSPAIDGNGRIVFGSQDKNVYCLNADGSLAWKFLTGEEVRSSPAIGTDGTVYVGSGKDNRLNAIKSDGSLKWKYDAGGWVRSSPAIATDGTIYVGSSNGKLHAVNPDGSGKWAFSATDYIENCSPAIAANGRIYIGSGDDRLYCINPVDGLEIWHYTTGADIDGSPAIDANGVIYVGSDDFKLHAINPDGMVKWTYTTGALVDSGALVGEDGRIYFGSSDGSLYCIGPVI
jgi:outer membrane protein assembly factor BamB